MSHMVSGILGAVAATLALGAVHLEVAEGNDLFGPAQQGAPSVFDARTFEAQTTGLARPDSGSAIHNVDRSAKGDRDTVARIAGGSTLSFKIPGTPDGSILLRVPSGEAADAVRKSPAPVGSTSPRGSAVGRRAIACEPSVSVLTAVAKQLEPGRCIT
ncbi:MAG: hypothetical protein V4661_09615 [Pseudomonadota bacterium]